MEAAAAAADEDQVLRVHGAAGLALVQSARGGEGTRWIHWPPGTREASACPARLPDERGGDAADAIPLSGAPNDESAPASLDLKRDDFDPRVEFDIASSADQLTPQNVVVFLHGRGDSHAPFARLGVQMALPQTGVISLRAPLQLPFDMGSTWIDDLDDDFGVIPPTAATRKRSRSLQATRDFVWAFLQTLRDRYHWRLDRVFLFGFSQGASVAFHVARTLPTRLGGVVLVAGGAVNGPHDAPAAPPFEHETPALLICGGRDDVFPLSMAEESERQYAATFTNPRLLTRHVVPNKTHDMIRSRDEMRVVMQFFSAHLFLRNVALENRSDIIEISSRPHR